MIVRDTIVISDQKKLKGHKYLNKPAAFRFMFKYDWTFSGRKALKG